MYVDDFNEFGAYEWWERALARKSYAADFETTTQADDCRVWAVATCEVGNVDNVEYGKDVPWFVEWCAAHAQCNVFFHNLAFDGAFLMDWLLRNGWEFVKDGKAARDRTFSCLVSEANAVYCIDLFFTRQQNVRIMDSLKIIPISIKAMSKAYGLPIAKGEINYEAYREPGYEMTEEEREYIAQDVKIDAMVLGQFFDKGLRKMTAGSNALSDYMAEIGGRRCFRNLFPLLDEEADGFIRKAYRGGFTYANPKYKEQLVGNGIVLDVNSLYPSVMHSCSGEILPYGQPKWVDGKPRATEEYPLWVASATMSFRLCENHIPCIQLKGNFRFKQTEYLERSDGEVTFAFTNVDWDLITEHYHIYDLKWHGAFMFHGQNFAFNKYIDKWVAEKNEATIEGNSGKRSIAKLMLNSLYGKFATRTTVYSRYPVLENDVLVYRDLDPEERDAVYLPVGVFVTSWARYKTISSAQAVYDRFLYADTDSLHLLGTDIPEGLDVDPVKLGAWKHESTFEQAKFLGAKCYAEQEAGKPLTVHVSGMPMNVHEQVTLENFKFGAVYTNKLYTHRVPGGIVLEPGEMEIRPR